LTKLRIALACGAYDRTQALADGLVDVEGIDLNYIPLHPVPTFQRMLQHSEFDASEMSLSNFLMLLSRGDDRFVGIPAFTYRQFRHSLIWLNPKSGIREPKDLAGKRIGIPDYSVTALLFLRGLLQHEYGVRAESINWVRVWPERVKLDLPPEIRIEDAPGESLERLLDQNVVDAVASFQVPRPVTPGAPQPLRLFPNTMQVEADYYRKTGIFPIMHLIVVKRELYEKDRWIAASLMKAFQASKRKCYEMLDEDSFAAATSVTPWLRAHAEAAQEVFHGDLYPYGVKPNLPTLEAATTYSFEQHLSKRKIAVGDGELFAPETLAIQD
jgi:4,5-dihydroxyphthalate decarboxylase